MRIATAEKVESISSPAPSCWVFFSFEEHGKNISVVHVHVLDFAQGLLSRSIL